MFYLHYIAIMNCLAISRSCTSRISVAKIYLEETLASFTLKRSVKRIWQIKCSSDADMHVNNDKTPVSDYVITMKILEENG